jgi:hypothetical protein
MKADYLENCHCGLLCPCLFAVIPTYGNGHVPIAYHIREGHDGNVCYPLQGTSWHSVWVADAMRGEQG